MISTDSYIEFVQQQRTAREARLISNPRNWFSLIGLFPLNKGENRLGGSQSGSITIPGLPAGFTAALNVTQEEVALVESSAGVLINGTSAQPQALRTDRDEETDVLTIGEMQVIVIQRGERFFLRAWDLQSSIVKEFSGLNYFAVDPFYRITAGFRPFPQPMILPVVDVIGTSYESRFIGRAEFTMRNVQCSLIAEDDEGQLLFNFTDLTKADLTYPGGRLISTVLPENNEVILDFNLARNWPCAYTAHATCPLPPFENHLKVRIEAGEKRYHPTV